MYKKCSGRYDFGQDFFKRNDENVKVIIEKAVDNELTPCEQYAYSVDNLELR